MESFSESKRLTSGGQGDETLNKVSPLVVKSYTLSNNNRMEVMVITWGATIVSLKCPDKFGQPADIVMGFDNLESYMDPTLNPFIGCVLGRCANRIKDGYFSIKDKDYQLSLNDDNKHHLHGGLNGFGRQVWESHVEGCSVVMSYLSDDNEEGYPGAVLVTIKFKLTPDNKLEINMRATTSKPTIVNMSHGSHFNLAGHDAGEKELNKHSISLNCDRWTFADYTDPIPTGAIRGVGGTIMDLRIPRLMGDVMDKVPPGEGYDHNFCVVRNWQPGISFVARASHPPSGRVLEIYSDQPGVQFYTGGHLPSQSFLKPQFSYNDYPEEGKSQIEELDNGEEDSREFEHNYGKGEDEGEDKNVELKQPEAPRPKPLKFIPGKNNAKYKKRSAFSIQPQNYPNAINYKHFPCMILHPGQVYYHDLTYKFGIQLKNFM